MRGLHRLSAWAGVESPSESNGRLWWWPHHAGQSLFGSESEIAFADYGKPFNEGRASLQRIADANNASLCRGAPQLRGPATERSGRQLRCRASPRRHLRRPLRLPCDLRSAKATRRGARRDQRAGGAKLDLPTFRPLMLLIHLEM